MLRRSRLLRGGAAEFYADGHNIFPLATLGKAQQGGMRAVEAVAGLARIPLLFQLCFRARGQPTAAGSCSSSQV